MKLTSSLTVIILLMMVFSIPVPAMAQSDDPGNQEPYAGEVLCVPGAYLETPQDCLALGPSAYLTELAKMGITLPPPPLATFNPPLDYSIVPYEYIKVTTKSAVPIYNSVEDGGAGVVARMMGFGFRYMAIKQRVDSAYGIYYQFQTGEWIWGGDVSRVSPPFFEGLLFRQNPRLPFGWILEDTQSKTLPGPDGVKTGHTLRRFDIVYVYQTTRIGDVDWYLIGPDEWVEMRYLAKVNFNPLPPQGVENNRWIEIDLQQQVLMVYEQGQLVFATMVSTGIKPFYTRPGLHQIYKKMDEDYMTYADPADYYYLEDVPWIMYFDQSRALHGAYWHSFFGYPRSHGCVNLSISDARWLYGWAHEGDYVYVWDPSGTTPTDPSYYKDSGGP
jgi:hypothetical protein